MLLGSRTRRTSLVNSTTQTSVFKLGQFLASPISSTFMFASHVNCGCCRLSLIFVTSWRAARIANFRLVSSHFSIDLQPSFLASFKQFPLLPNTIPTKHLQSNINPQEIPSHSSLSLYIYTQNILFEKNLPLSLVVPSSITASANFLTSLDASPGDATKGVPASPASATEGSIGSSKTCSIPKVSLANLHVGWQIPNLRGGHRNRKFACKCWCFICKSSTVHFLRNQYYVNHIQPSIPMLTYTTKSTENTQALKPWEEFCRGVRKVQKLDEVEIQYMNCRKFNFPWFLGRRVTMISNDAGICPSVGWHVIKFPWLKYTVICFVLLGLLHGA